MSGQDAPKVLFAEDSRVQALLLGRTLREAGYDVTAAVNGAEALAAVRTAAPDIIISDIEMPEMDGIAFCHAVKDDPELCSIPIIMVTSLATPSDLIRAIAAGADTYITKPYDGEALLARIEERLAADRQDTRLSDRPEESVVFAGTPYAVRTSQQHTINFLLALYANVSTQNDELQRLNDRKNELLGVAAVEVRSPLSDILAAVKLLQGSASGDLNPAQTNLVERVRLSAEIIQQTVDGQLDARAIEESELHLDTRPANLSDIVDNAVVLHRLRGEGEGVEVQFQRPPTPANAIVDGVKVEQAVNALIVFAMGRAGSGQSVVVKVEGAAQQLTLAVCDSGPEMSAEALGRLYANDEALDIEAGVRTGLAIARKVVNAHGGQVWAENAEDGGVKVGFDLPGAAPAAYV
ncbi:hypothetical protein CMK11_18585 [Candidatus Poribacteria bacterium]|nr:hypothetical protein [Candidatus Poribacteria bacterium]